MPRRPARGLPRPAAGAPRRLPAQAAPRRPGGLPPGGAARAHRSARDSHATADGYCHPHRHCDRDADPHGHSHADEHPAPDEYAHTAPDRYAKGLYPGGRVFFDPASRLGAG